MADLSSCYFCGAAMDVSLREYPVVPEALAPTPADQETVVLCGACQRKLGRVLDPVVAAATSGDRNGGDTANRDRARTRSDGVVSPPDPDRTTSNSDGGGMDPVVPPNVVDDADDDTTAGTSRTDSNAGADDATGAGSTPFEVDDTASVFDADDTGEEDTDEEDGSESIFADGTTTVPDPDDVPRGGGFGDTDPTKNTRRSTNEDAGSTGSGNGSTSSRKGSSNSGNDSTGTASGSTGSGNDSAGSDDAAPEHDVDPQTYNKVVRLLKNRDLPVPRHEIEEVAGSAYAIPEHECEAIVDAAIHRGLVDERNGDLVYPDGV